MQCPSDRLLHAWVQEVTKCGIKFDHRFASRATSQVKSAPTPAGEPNVRAEAEKRKIYTTKKCQTLYNLQASLTELRRNNYAHTHTIPVRVKATVREGHGKLLAQKFRKHGKRESPIGPHFSQQFPNCRKPCTCKTFPISCPKFVAGAHAEDMLYGLKHL